MTLKVSRLLDGQLDEGDVRQALHDVVADDALRDRYTVYGLIGDALRGNGTPDDAFTPRILERLRREGARMEPGYDPLQDLEPPAEE